MVLSASLRRLAVELTLCLFIGWIGLSAPSAHAAFVWDQASLVSDRVGFEAVLIDPDDPQTVWVASTNSLWVSDDGGEAWYVVAQFLGGSRVDASVTDRSTMRRRAQREEDTDQDDAEEFTDEGNESKDVIQEEAVTPRVRGRAGRTGASVGLQFNDKVRLRLINDSVYVMTAKGLWRVPRAARGLGQGERIRLRRQSPVLDVALSPWGMLLISTPRGLLERGEDGQIFPAPHALGRRGCGVMLALADAVLVSSERSVWRLDARGARRPAPRAAASG